MTWDGQVAGITGETGLKFNARAGRVVTLAQAEARRLNRNRAGEDDLLRGLIIERDGAARSGPGVFGADLDDLAGHLDEHRAVPHHPIAGPVALDDGARKILELAAQEPAYLGHRYVGCEHILLGLLRAEGGAARILAQHHINLHRASWRVQELLDHYQFGRRHDR